MSELPYHKLLEEWRCGAEVLADVLGEPVTVASVPGGGVSQAVVAAAAEAGVRVLFTSEPTGRVHRLGGCSVIGRYAIKAGYRPRTVAALAAGDPVACGFQWVSWNTRKTAKYALGSGYYVLRERILHSLDRRR